MSTTVAAIDPTRVVVRPLRALEIGPPGSMALGVAIVFAPTIGVIVQSHADDPELLAHALNAFVRYLTEHPEQIRVLAGVPAPDSRPDREPLDTTTAGCDPGGAAEGLTAETPTPGMRTRAPVQQERNGDGEDST